MERDPPQEDEPNEEARKSNASRNENKKQLASTKRPFASLGFCPRPLFFLQVAGLCTLKPPQECQNYYKREAHACDKAYDGDLGGEGH